MNPFAYIGSTIWQHMYYAWPLNWGKMAALLKEDPRMLVTWNLSSWMSNVLLFSTSLAYPPWAREAAAMAGVWYESAAAVVGELLERAG